MTTRDWIHALDMNGKFHHGQQVPSNGASGPPSASLPFTSLTQPSILHASSPFPPTQMANLASAAATQASTQEELVPNSYPASFRDQGSTDKEEGELSEAANSMVSSSASHSPQHKPPTAPRNPSIRGNSSAGDRPKPRAISGVQPPTGPRSSLNQPRSTSLSIQHKSGIPPVDRWRAASSSTTKTADAPSASLSTRPRNRSTSNSVKSSVHTSTSMAPVSPDSAASAFVAEREHAKVFIESWSRSGHTFQQLVDEGLNAEILRQFYDELGIPIAPRPAVPSAQPSPLQPTLDNAMTQPDTSTSISPTTPQQYEEPLKTRPITQPNDLPDRQSYIARLMAAKGKKTASEKPQASPQPVPSSSKTQPVVQTDPSLPKPPILSAALQSLNQLCAKLGLGAPSFSFEQIREQAFAVQLRVASFPNHLIPHLKSCVAVADGQKWKCMGADISIEYDSVILFQHQGFPSKKVAKQGIAQVGFTVILAASERYEQMEPSLREVHPETIHTKPPPKHITEYENKKKPSEEVPVSGSIGVGSEKNAARSATASTAAAISETKRKAQTALLRRKMEALKSSKIQASKTAKSSTANDSTTTAALTPIAQSEKGPNTHELSRDQQDKPSPGSLASQIPGLFMSTPSAAVDTESPMSESVDQPSKPSVSSKASPLYFPPTTSTKVRKRPVAADFHDDMEPPVMKRPFGQIRGGDEDEAMIIEASEDENDHENLLIPGELDLDQNLTGGRPGETASRKLANSGPLRSLASEYHSQGVERTQTPTHGEIGFDKRQKQILQMKKKIAEMEYKRRSKLSSSRPNTPATNNITPQAEASDSSLHLGDKLNRASQQALRHKEPSSDLSATADLAAPNQNSDKPVSPHSSSLSVPGQLDWKQRRRTEITSNLPALEASVEDDSRELERLRLQMERLQDEMRKKQENKSRLIEELESLGIDTQGMQHSELLATKDFFDARHQEQLLSNNEDPEIDMAPSTQSLENSSASSMSISSPEETSAPMIQDTAKIIEHGSKFSATKAQDLKPDETGATPDHSSQSVALSGDEPAQNAETGAQDNAIPHSLTSHGPIEDQSDARTPVSGSSAHYADDESMDSSDGSDELLEHRSSPSAEVYNAASDHLSTNQDPEPAEPMAAAQKLNDLDPSDVAEPSAASNPDMAFSGDDMVVDKAESDQMDESEDEYEPDDHYLPPGNPESDETSPSNAAHESSLDTTMQAEEQNMKEQELAPDVPSQDGQDQNHSEPEPDQDLSMEERFTPYQSSLRNFTSSRKLAEGFTSTGGEPRSLAVPYGIDPEVELCPFELAGGVCNDDKCNHQHFRSMNLERLHQG